MAGLLSSEILDEAALLLNDASKVTFTYVLTAPWLKRAVNALSDKFAVNSIPIERKQSIVLPVTAISTTITLPADCLIPIKLEERALGSSDRFIEMIEVKSLPTDQIADTSLVYWAFQGTLSNSTLVIDTLRASSNREIRVTYERFLPYSTIVDGTSDFGSSITWSCKRYLAAHVAADIAMHVLQNEKRYKLLLVEQEDAGNSLVKIWVKKQQNIPVRRPGYSRPPSNVSSYPSGGGGGGGGTPDLSNVAFINLANIFSQTQRISGVTPALQFNETDVGLDVKNWDINIDAQVLTIRSLNDNYALLNFLLFLDRGGNLKSGGRLETTNYLRFPATQVPSAGANDLDDYEEGSFTPTLSFGGASVGITYVVNVGTYTKIGNYVYVDIILFLSSKGVSVGSALISGLPFPAITNIPIPVDFAGGTFAGLTGAPYLLTLNSTLIPLQSSATGGLGLADTNFTNGSLVRASGMYKVS